MQLTTALAFKTWLALIYLIFVAASFPTIFYLRYFDVHFIIEDSENITKEDYAWYAVMLTVLASLDLFICIVLYQLLVRPRSNSQLLYDKTSKQCFYVR